MKSSNLPKTLFLISGPPGAGKTTYARNLAKTNRAALLDIDISTENLVKAALTALEMDPNDRDSPRYKNIFRNPIYQTLFEIAKVNLPHTDVIITGPFTSESENANWLDDIRATIGIPCSVRAIYLNCSEKELKSRIENRSNPRDRSKLENWDKYWEYFKNCKAPLYPHQFIDTSSGEI